MRKVIPQLLGNTEKSYYRWKEEKRPIILLLEKYFSKEDLQEFIDTQKIELLEEFIAFKLARDDNQEYKMFKKFLKFQAWEQWQEFQKNKND